MKKWKVALIGCGSIADNTYLPRIGEIPEADLVAVCDIIPERAKNYAEKFHVPAWYTSIDELLEKCDFEILMNTTSIPAHHEINMKALRAGKHLYSQKPVGLTVEEVTEQIEAAKAAGVKYTASPIHMLRDDIRFAKKLIADGCIGEIMKVHTNVCHGGPEYFQYRTADPTWFHRPGSGALYDMGVHGLVEFHDLAAHLPRPAHDRPAKTLLALPHRDVPVSGAAGRDVDTPEDLERLRWRP